MIPNDLTGFTVEQLRGFATAVDQHIATLRTEAREDADKLAAIEAAIDERDRLSTAISEALAALEAEGAVDDAVAGDGDDDTTEGDEDEDDAEGDTEGDADAAVDEAVASATLGGGTAPRAKGHIRVFTPDSVRTFMRNAMTGRIEGEGRINFASLTRETNHTVGRGSDATSAIAAAVRDRLAGTDKTAAGCFCGPDEARDSIARALVEARPFSDSLPTVTGGDFRFIRQIDLTGATAGVTIWECDDQDDVDPDVIATWKPCYELECEPEVTTETYGVPACATFNVQQLIGNPNLIDNLEHVMTVAYNRAAELEAYARVLAQASQVTYNASALPTGYGASAKLIKAVAWAMSTIRATHRDRLDYTLALPAGLRERVLGDGMIRATDDYRTWDDIVTRLNELGVSNIVELYDPLSPPSALPAIGGPPVEATQQPLAQQIMLYRPDNFVLGMGPELDLGVTRSPEMNRQNKLQWFVESFESVTRIGVQPTVAITADFCDNGIRPAFGEGDDCAA